MAFDQPTRIKDAIEGVHRKRYVLPAIQREFVWSTKQIEKLFDSLMSQYPIGSFLFWKIEKKNIKKYQFYEFIRDYHERENKHNPKADLKGEHSITAILDGQQRLTALYIGLKGTYAYKLPRKRWDNDSAFPKRKLCLNLLPQPADSNEMYHFRFLTEEEYSKSDENHFWFVVGDILNLEEAHQVNDYLLDNGLLRSNEGEKSKYANSTLFKLWEVIHKTESINFFLEEGESLDRVLNIFIRVNSGGTQLSYSDLLLSIATAQWKEKDAREEITTFVDEINGIGHGFDFNKDFVLKNCLVLSDCRDIAFKVDNFNQKNMLHIEQNWGKLSHSVRSAVILLSSLGYHRDTLTSNNALIPIAYYLNKIGNPDTFAESSRYKEDRKKIFKWLVIALLKRTFGGKPDDVIRPTREAIRKSSNGFPYWEILEKLKGTPRAMSFDDDEIENLLHYQYGQAYTYSVLAFIYPSLDFRNKFHQDHIFPKRLFTPRRLRNRGIEEAKIGFYMDSFNYLANLQLLEGIPNQEKSGKEFKEWLVEKYPDESDRAKYMERHYIPTVELSLDNFEEFINERKRLLVGAFRELSQHKIETAPIRSENLEEEPVPY